MLLLKKIIFRIMVLVFLLFLFIGIANLWVMQSTKNSLFATVEKIPPHKVGLVLGTSPTLSNGRNNLYFTSRITAAVDLYRAGKVTHLILSGDNGTHSYNEPKAMQEALLKQGIPDTAITLDYAGFRTLDSVVRCKEIFGQSSFTIISQKWHNYRAVFIAQSYDLNVAAYNAPKVINASSKAKIREVLARVKAILDLYLFNKQPKFLGEEEPLK